MAMNNHNSSALPNATSSGPDDLAAVIGNAPPSPSWPIYGWGLIWVFWLLFLLFMVVQR